MNWFDYDTLKLNDYKKFLQQDFDINSFNKVNYGRTLLV